MGTFADYILNEEDYLKKLEIAYYLQKKTGIFFDNSVLLKTEIARMFMDSMDLNVDKNLVLTACLLCTCKKKKDATDIQTIKNYAQDGAKYLFTLGFDKRFCKICEEVNRYSGSTPREIESDILELVDNFGGLVLDRPERKGFPIDEALVLTEYRNLKGQNNIFLEQFKKFVLSEEGILTSDYVLKTEDDFNGEISNLIKVTKACIEEGLDVKFMMNILRRTNPEDAYKQIKDKIFIKSETQMKIERLKEIEERTKDFGILKRNLIPNAF